jgi:hypothetical protein
MILKRIVVQNFLSFRERLSIDIDRNITILLGSNDHGKSNLLKALEHLNDEVPITEDECNWDSFGTPALSFEFDLTAPELQKWAVAVEEAVLEIEEGNQSVTSGAQNLPSESVKWPQPPVGLNLLGPGILPATPKVAKREWLPVDVPQSLLKPSVTGLTLSRLGVGNSLEIAGLPIFGLPDGMSRFLDEGIPRVELFEVTAGEFKDAATAQSINTERLNLFRESSFALG